MDTNANTTQDSGYEPGARQTWTINGLNFATELVRDERCGEDLRAWDVFEIDRPVDPDYVDLVGYIAEANDTGFYPIDLLGAQGEPQVTIGAAVRALAALQNEVR